MVAVPTNRHLLIDADILLYRCGFAAEKTKYLVMPAINEYDNHKAAKAAAGEDGEIWSRREVQPVEFAIQNLQTTIEGITSALWPGESKFLGDFFLTGKGNFRELIRANKEYKDNRDPSHRPKHYRALKEYLVKKCGAVVTTGEEADDAIGRAAYGRDMDSYVVVSNDKDLDQIAGHHYDWTKKESYFVNEEDAIKFFYRQLLSGDSTDNIGGVLSAAKAEALIGPLESPKACAEACRKVYEEKYPNKWRDEIESTASLVWIRRAFNTEKVEGGDLHPFWLHLRG